MSNVNRWTPQMDEMLIELKKKGLSFNAIVREFGEVGIVLSRNSCIGRYNRLRKAGRVESGRTLQTRPWTCAEEKLLVQRIFEGEMLKNIAVELKRSFSAVKSKWRELRPLYEDQLGRRKPVRQIQVQRKKPQATQAAQPEPITYDDPEPEHWWHMTPEERRELYREHPRSIMFLSDRYHLPASMSSCRFIIGDRDQWRYCNRQATQGVYCDEHYELCHGGQTE